MPESRPSLFVVDDDRALLSLVGTGLTCLDILRALRNVSPRCEAVLTTGYQNLQAVIDALRQQVPGQESSRQPSVLVPASATPASLMDVERDHIVRTLGMVRGNKAVAARLLGVSRRAFYRQLERHGLHQRAPMVRRGTNGDPRAEHKA